MHNVQPNQKIRIFQIEIAVSAEADTDKVADEIAALLSERGIFSVDDSYILDWQYVGEECTAETGEDEPEEGEVFVLPRTDVLPNERSVSYT